MHYSTAIYTRSSSGYMNFATYTMWKVSYTKMQTKNTQNKQANKKWLTQHFWYPKFSICNVGAARTWLVYNV